MLLHDYFNKNFQFLLMGACYPVRQEKKDCYIYCLLLTYDLRRILWECCFPEDKNQPKLALNDWRVWKLVRVDKALKLICLTRLKIEIRSWLSLRILCFTSFLLVQHYDGQHLFCLYSIRTLLDLISRFSNLCVSIYVCIVNIL